MELLALPADDRLLSISQAITIASRKGFSGLALINAVAIEMAESGLHTHPIDHINRDGSCDRGFWQFNSRWHPEVTDSCAYDPECSTEHAYNISSGGRDFSAWWTYTHGDYLQYVPLVQHALRDKKTIPQPPVIWLGTNGVNVWPGKAMPTKAIVLHVMEGSLDGCIQWFRNPQAQASANYGVGKDGRIIQFVRYPDAPFANGILNNPDGLVSYLYKQSKQVNPNYWTKSIETERFHTEPLTPAQLHSVAWISAWEAQQAYIIPQSNSEDDWESILLGHYEFDDVTRANCPGLDRNGWITYATSVLNFFNGVQSLPDDMKVADFIWSISQMSKLVKVERINAPDLFLIGQPGKE